MSEDNLPTPMVSYSGTARQLHDIIFKAVLESDAATSGSGRTSPQEEQK